MRITIVILLAVVLITACLGCSRKEVPAPGKPARVSATGTFETYFGPAPTTDKGTCYAFVIYFPGEGEGGKVTPFPFFSFDEGTLKKVAIERLIGGLDSKTFGAFPQVFPKGTRLLSLSQQGGTVSADFSGELRPVADDQAKASALKNAITLTLLQFSGVTEVRIKSEGRDLFPPAGRSIVEAAVTPPSAPRLVGLVAMREASGKPVQEVDALFDRPVEVKQCQFLEADGTPLAGDVFQSMFDMAAVLKPRDPGKLTQGMKVTVRYHVVDKLGRPATGVGSFALEIKQHQD